MNNMLNVDVYFNSNRNNDHIRIENVIMVQTVLNELVIIFKVENFEYNFTEIKRVPMGDIEYYLVGFHM